MRSAVLVVICGSVVGAGNALAGTLEVGPGKTYTTIAAAAAAATDGDTVAISAGTFHETVTWSASNLTVRGVGGRPILDMTGMTISNGKAIFVTAGSNITIENLEFTGASVASGGNGAGIRWEGGGSLTVRNCVFRSNEDGILGGNVGGMHPENTALVELNEFVDNGRGDVGFTHSVYFGEADTITFRGNWSHAMYPLGADVGHLFKSRAHHTYVLYNRLTAEDTQSSYEVNLPEGGEAFVIGNLIQQRVGGQRVMISFGDGDGTQYTGSHLYVVNNTIVNESPGAATFIRTTQTDAQIVVVNNLVVGPGTLTMGGVVTMNNNVMTTMPAFVDQTMFDYQLLAGSPAIDAGSDPGMGGTMSLAPAFQYVHPMGIEPRGPAGAIDVGAYEFNNMPAAGDGAIFQGDVTASSQPGGCCAVGRDRDTSLLLTAAVAAILCRRRKRS